ncbi:Uncharacterised protein [Actinobacillus equuli]|nr:Uncharacterised protein [Actinobacillus equuli]
MARTNKLKTKKLLNNKQGEILAENLLDITVQGEKIKIKNQTAILITVK